MKYAVFFKYEAKVEVEAEGPDEAFTKASDMPIDFGEMYYTDSYDIEEVA